MFKYIKIRIKIQYDLINNIKIEKKFIVIEIKK